MLDLSIIIVNYRSWSKLEGYLLSIDTHIIKYKKVILVDYHFNGGKLESLI